MVEPQPYEVGEEIGKRLIELQRQIDALQLQFARVSWEFVGSEYYEDEGLHHPAQLDPHQLQAQQGRRR